MQHFRSEPLGDLDEEFMIMARMGEGRCAERFVDAPDECKDKP
jgi:hypothetical protein